jgi:hypothetical protein
VDELDAFCTALGGERPRGNWFVHVTVRADARRFETVFEVTFHKTPHWSISIQTASGFVLVENGTLMGGSPEPGAALPAAPTEVPRFVAEVGATHGLTWDFSTIRCGGNRVLAKLLKVWMNDTLASHVLTVARPEVSA